MPFSLNSADAVDSPLSKGAEEIAQFLAEDCGPDIDDVYTKSNSKGLFVLVKGDRQQRYQSAAEMRKDLDYPGEVQITGRVDRLEPVKPMQVGLRRYWVVFLMIGLAILFCVILLLTRLRIHVEVR